MCWSIGQDLASYERQAIEKAFRFYEGNKSLTARVLGISIRTLDARLDEYRKSDERRQKQFEESYAAGKTDLSGISPNTGAPRVLRSNRERDSKNISKRDLSTADSDSAAEEQVG